MVENAARGGGSLGRARPTARAQMKVGPSNTQERKPVYNFERFQSLGEIRDKWDSVKNSGGQEGHTAVVTLLDDLSPYRWTVNKSGGFRNHLPARTDRQE
jgi:hypothetical protein